MNLEWGMAFQSRIQGFVDLVGKHICSVYTLSGMTLNVNEEKI